MATRSRSLRPPLVSPPRSSSDSGGARGGTAALPGSAAGRRADTTTHSGRPRSAADELADRRGDLPGLRRPPGLPELLRRERRAPRPLSALHCGSSPNAAAGALRRRRRRHSPDRHSPDRRALIDAALSEMVFHDLPIRGSKHLAHAQLVHRLGVALIARRDLLLVGLTSDACAASG